MIYLLEDDDSIRDFVIYTLNSQGMEARGFPLPSLFWQAVGEQMPALVLLDIMLPEEDGLSVLKKLRATPRTAKLPVIMLTAKGTEYDKVVGLDGGADDYVAKPFGMMELLSRIRALLRRQGGQVDRLVFGNTTLDLDADTLTCGEKKMRLSAKEFDVMRLLMQAGENNTPKESILTHVWGFDSDAVENNVEVYIGFLRKKLKGQQVHAGWRGSGL